MRVIPGEAARAASAFFFHNFNHTLSSVLARRASLGASPASTIVLGASIPVPGCSRFSAPVTTAVAHAMFARPDVRNLTKYYDHWRLSFQLNAVARSLATPAGAWFIDVAEPSMQRPDAAKGWFRASLVAWEEDCLHYCPPGPVDEWARMLNQVLHEGSVFPIPRQRRSHMFAINYSEWSSVYGIFDKRFEKPTTREAQVRWSKDAEAPLSARSWWPFHACDGGMSRALV